MPEDAIIGATLFRTTVSAVGAEAGDLISAGVLILFAAGAPPELAEVSVLHDDPSQPGPAPVSGDVLRIGAHDFRITAVGETAWQKVADIGHVVFSFSGADAAERPGEICVERADTASLLAALAPGVPLAVHRGDSPGREAA